MAKTLKGNLEKIAQHGKRADAIVKNMLLHSREGSGDHRPVDVNALVEESLNLAYHGARAEKQGFKSRWSGVRRGGRRSRSLSARSDAQSSSISSPTVFTPRISASRRPTAPISSR